VSSIAERQRRERRRRMSNERGRNHGNTGGGNFGRTQNSIRRMDRFQGMAGKAARGVFTETGR
jgi:hypothetical protein